MTVNKGARIGAEVEEDARLKYPDGNDDVRNLEELKMGIDCGFCGGQCEMEQSNVPIIGHYDDVSNPYDVGNSTVLLAQEIFAFQRRIIVNVESRQANSQAIIVGTIQTTKN